MDDSAFGGQAFGSALYMNTPAPVPATGEAGAAGGGSALAFDSPAAPPASAPQGGIFGSGIGYQPAQSADPLDIEENMLRQRVQRAQAASTGAGGALVQLFNPEARQHNLSLIDAGTKRLMEIQAQRATIQANRQEASTLGLAPGEAPDLATREQRLTIAKDRALKGDLKVYQGLMAVDPKAAESISDQVYEVTANHLNNAQYAYDKLSMMSSQGEYSAAVKSLREQGVIKDIEALGYKVPDSFEQFNAVKAREGQALRQARIYVDAIGRKLEERNTYTPMEKKEAETYDGRLTTVYGDKIQGIWARNGASNTRGLIVNGAADPRDLGKSFTLGQDEQRKSLREEKDNAVPKEELEKWRSEKRTYDLATRGAKPGRINSNPNVQQGVAEGLASMLRGGQGGANIGLLKIETAKRGFIQGLIDKITTEKNATINELSGKDVLPYLSELTQGQIRDVLDALKQWNDKTIESRIAPIAERAGALGFKPSALGFSDAEAEGVISDAFERGRQAQIQRMMPLHQAIGGGDGVLQLGAQRPGVGATGLPPGTQNVNQLPGAPPLATPAQQAAQPSTPPAAPQPAPAATQPPTAQGGSGPPAPNQPAGGPPAPASGGSGAGGPAPMQAQDPVHYAMAGTQQALTAFAQANGGTPADVDREMQRLATNPRVEKELSETGQVSGKTVAAALGAGGNKSLVRHLTDFLSKWFMSGVVIKGDGLVEQLRNGMKPYGGYDSLEEWQAARDKAYAKLGNAAVEYAPAIGSTVGAIAGGLSSGPVGGIAGGAVGGAGGQAFKDYMQGRPQDPAAIAEQGALGAIFGVGGPGLGGMVLRAGGAGAIVGAKSALDAAREGKSTPEVVDAGLTEGAKTAALSAGSEMIGRALGMAGHKLWSLFSSDAKQEIIGAAETLATARKTLETAEPKIAGATGAVDNPKYVEAEAAVQKAEQVIKNAGLKPEEVEYAYKVASEGVPKAEAQVSRPGALERQRVGQGYQQLENEVGAAGVGAPKAAPKLADGPIAAVASKQVSAKHAELAQRTEMAITAPASNWVEKWVQLKDERSKLLQLERDALSSTATGKSLEARDMRTLADTVRVQQEKIAKYVFGEQKGAEFVKRLEVLDARYRRLMDATNGGDLAAAAKLKGEPGRAADRAFKAFAHDDPAAIVAWNQMRAIKGDEFEATVPWTVAAEGIPVLGKVVKLAKLHSMMKEWAAERAAGAPVKFFDLLPKFDDNGAAVSRAVGSAAQRMTVQ